MAINLFGVWRKREADIGRRIRYQEVAAETGVSTTTLSRWSKGRATRFDLETIQALCDFFKCGVEELIVIDRPDGVTYRVDCDGETCTPCDACSCGT